MTSLPRRSVKLFFNPFILFILLIVLAYPENGRCTIEYERQTGKSCSDCHIDPIGGGKLTKDGESFKDELRIKGQYRVLSPVQRVVRFIIGYLHTFTAILWFGTILYVHIVLKPSYAARGLPKGELKLGWASIGIMAVTGTLLSIARVPSWHMLFHTRFGILLTIKIILFLIMCSTAVFVTFVVGPRLKKKRGKVHIAHRGDMTPDELSECDGREGRPGHIAYKGTIYDVSKSKLWREGSHAGKHHAGIELTDVLRTAPHGEDKVFKMPVIGQLLIGKETKKPPHIKMFYFFAYMNLVLIFLIVFVISLRRWW